MRLWTITVVIVIITAATLARLGVEPEWVSTTSAMAAVAVNARQQ